MYVCMYVCVWFQKFCYHFRFTMCFKKIDIFSKLNDLTIFLVNDLRFYQQLKILYLM